MQKNLSWYGGWFLIMILLVSGCATPTPQEPLTPEEARRKARHWGFSEEDIDGMISAATQPPSYWSRGNNEA